MGLRVIFCGLYFAGIYWGSDSFGEGVDYLRLGIEWMNCAGGLGRYEARCLIVKNEVFTTGGSPSYIYP